MKTDLFSGTIRDISGRGSGVVDHPNGLVFFVHGTWPGDVGTFKVLSTQKRFGFAELVTLETPSEFRVEPVCKHHGFYPEKCGGCPWMMAKYSSQLQFKQQLVEHRFQRAKLIDDDTAIHQIWLSANTTGYRNRAELKTNGKKIGFVSPSSNTLAPVNDCPILSDHNRKTLAGLIAKLPNQNWQPKRGQKWTSLQINHDVSADDVVANHSLSFLQANDEQNERMKSWLSDKLLQIENKQTLIELFAGSGNFTEAISKTGFQKIVAAESSIEAVAKLNSKNLPNCHGLVKNLYKPQAWKQIFELAGNAGSLLLDPPRDGFKTISEFTGNLPQLRDIFYISCNIETMIRDLSLLDSARWRVREIQPLDQFPHTPHIELLIHIQRRS